MRTLPLLLIVLVVATPASQQTAVSNPCEPLPPSQPQMNDCAAYEYKQADGRLNKVYGRAMKHMTDHLAAQETSDHKQTKYEQAGIASLKEAERAWLCYRDIQCKRLANSTKAGA